MFPLYYVVCCLVVPAMRMQLFWVGMTLRFVITCVSTLRCSGDQRKLRCAEFRPVVVIIRIYSSEER